MVVAIDFDGTLKRSSQFDLQEINMWKRIVQEFLNENHVVYICTHRSNKRPIENKDIFHYASCLGIPHSKVIFCDMEGGKRLHLEADIWIDDMPELI